VPLRIVSDGLDYAIHRILANHGLSQLPVVANHLRWCEDHWELESPYQAEGCRSGTCKCTCAAQARADEAPRVLMIGDGSSDFCVSEDADFVFAKRRLITHCTNAGIEHAAIDTFRCNRTVAAPARWQPAAATSPRRQPAARRTAPAAGHRLSTPFQARSPSPFRTSFTEPNCMNIFDKNADAAASDAQLLADEARYSSFGDTVHYVDPPKIFQRGEGSYMFDGAGVPYLDLQMWYSACNFGYSNKRLNDALKDQIDTLPQVASQYLHPTRVQLAKTIAVDMHKFGLDGRVHFNVGGAQAIEDSLKIVRNGARRQEPDVRLRGRLPRPHPGRLVDHLQLPLPPPLRPLRRARDVHPVPVPVPSPEGHDPGRVFRPLRVAVRAPVRKRIQRRVGSQGRPGRVRRVLRRADPGHRRLRHPAAQLLHWPQARAGQVRHPDGRR
jgi:hypothetical protein